MPNYSIVPSLDWKHLLTLLGNEVKLILDIGANDGGTSSVFQKLFPTAVVHAFEPDPRAISNCRRRVALGNIEHSRFNLHEVAVSDYDGVGKFFPSFGHNPNFPWYVTGNDLSGSLNEPLSVRQVGQEWLQFGESIDVKVVRLDSWLSEWPTEQIDLSGC